MRDKGGRSSLFEISIALYYTLLFALSRSIRVNALLLSACSNLLAEYFFSLLSEGIMISQLESKRD